MNPFQKDLPKSRPSRETKKKKEKNLFKKKKNKKENKSTSLLKKNFLKKKKHLKIKNKITNDSIPGIVSGLERKQKDPMKHLIS